MSLPIVAANSTVKRSFNTVQFSSGAPYTLAGTPSLHARVAGNATELTTGLSLTTDFDSKTGENQWTLDLSASASYTAGSIVEVFIAAGTVDSVSVVGLKVYECLIGTSGSLDALITRGLLALPAVAHSASGGLPTVGTSTGQISLSGGVAQADVAKINGVSTSSVTTVGANQGTTQPINFSGTGSTAYVKSDTEQLNAQAVTAAAGVTFPSSVASPTNITAASGISLASSQHVIVDSGTVTNLTNLPSIPAGWLTATGIAAGALNGKGDWSTLTQTQVTGGAYALNSASFGFNSAMDFTTAQKAATLARVALVDVATTSTNLTNNNDKTGYSLAANQHVIVDSGTVDYITDETTVRTTVVGSPTDTTVRLAGGTVGANHYQHHTATVVGSTNPLSIGQTNVCTSSDVDRTMHFTMPWGIAPIFGDTISVKADHQPIDEIRDGLATEATLDEVVTNTASLPSMIENSGGNRFKTKALEQAPTGSGGGGTGSLTVPVHVSDDDDADVVGKVVTVRLSGSLISTSEPTDSDGNTTVSVDPMDGYDFVIPGGNGLNGSTTEVDVADETLVELSVERNGFTSSDPSLTTCTGTVRDKNGPVAGVDVRLTILRFNSSETGLLLADASITVTSDANGYVQFPDRPRKAEYKVTFPGRDGVGGTGYTLDAAETPLRNSLRLDS